MSMTRRHFVALAEALRNAHPGPLDPNTSEGRAMEYSGRAEQHRYDAQAIADALAQDNPRFDRARFLRDAGVQS